MSTEPPACPTWSSTGFLSRVPTSSKQPSSCSWNDKGMAGERASVQDNYAREATNTRMCCNVVEQVLIMICVH